MKEHAGLEHGKWIGIFRVFGQTTAILFRDKIERFSLGRR